VGWDGELFSPAFGITGSPLVLMTHHAVAGRFPRLKPSASGMGSPSRGRRRAAALCLTVQSLPGRASPVSMPSIPMRLP
jgi:hypothetical protein